MASKSSFEVDGKEIIPIVKDGEDYISLTDMSRYKNSETTGLVISHWLSTRYTMGFMGV